jgi:hypothetical protein
MPFSFWSLIDTSTSRCRRACTAFLRRASSPISYSPNAWLPMNTGRPNPWAQVTFSLGVDDFCVKYEGLANAHHLIDALEQHYTVSKDLTGGL